MKNFFDFDYNFSILTVSNSLFRYYDLTTYHTSLKILDNSLQINYAYKLCKSIKLFHILWYIKGYEKVFANFEPLSSHIKKWKILKKYKDCLWGVVQVERGREFMKDFENKATITI